MFIGFIVLKIYCFLCQTSFLFSPSPPFLFAYLSIPVTAEVYSDITGGLWCSLVELTSHNLMSSGASLPARGSQSLGFIKSRVIAP